MIDFAASFEAYQEAGSALLRRFSKARTPAGRLRWERRRELNNQAYFVMLFAQFENEVEQRCIRLVRSKLALANWAARRPWEILEISGAGELRLPFMKQVALLFEKSSPDYAQVYGFYKTRCLIAHGNTTAVGPISVGTAESDLRALISRMRT